jgi:hypothetical protein
MGDIISQIVRTAVLCGMLGLLLYLGLAFMVESWLAPLLPAVITLTVSLVGLVLTGQTLIEAWRTYEFPTRGGVITREREPAWFWGSMIWCGAVALCLLGLLSYSCSLLMDVWSSMCGSDLAPVTDRASAAAGSMMPGWL